MTPASVPMSVTPIWTVARKSSRLSCRCFSRRAERRPVATSSSILLRRMEMTAISLPEKKPFPSSRRKITPLSINIWLTDSRLFYHPASVPLALSPLQVFGSVRSFRPRGGDLANGEFDVTVIGSGPGGYVAAVRAAQMGLRTAVVERDPTGCGGTCLLRGCIPTKALLHTADLYEDLKNGKEFGIVAEKIGIDFPAVMSRKARIVTRLSKGIETYLFKKNKITLFKGQGRLEGKGTLVVTSEKEERRVATRAIVLATGSRPKSLPGIVPDGRSIVTSDEILEITEIPKSLIVIGAWAVGIEFAS